MDILAENQLDNSARLIFLENFASAELPDDTRRTVIANLRRCKDVPPGLTERQRTLLRAVKDYRKVMGLIDEPSDVSFELCYGHAAPLMAGYIEWAIASAGKAEPAAAAM